MRTPETPRLARLETGHASRSLALYVLVDRSGSMAQFDQAVQEALLTVYLAAMQLAIPTGIALFGEDLNRAAAEVAVEAVVAEIAPLVSQEREEVKALIAGYSGWSSQEFLDWGLRQAEAALRPRPERLRVVIVIHDGEPVFKWRGGCDWDLSLARLRSLERSGITPIGVFLGDDARMLAKMRTLFPRLVACTGDHLPGKLGDLLSGLA